MDLEKIVRVGRWRLGHWNCLGETDLAAFVDGTLSPFRHRRAQVHLASCVECRDQVGTLVRLERAAVGVELDAHLLARALAVEQTTGSSPQRNQDWRWASATFAMIAATVIAAILLWPHQVPQLRSAVFGPQTAPSPAPAVASAAVPSRQIGTPSTLDIPRSKQLRRELVVLTPLQDSSVVRVPVIRWQVVEHAVSYDVRLLSADGDVLWSLQVDTDHAAIPSHVVIVPGSKYFVLVRAYLADGKTVDSRAVGFKVLRRS
jgi:anti-sigma factor RsiW